MKTLAFILIFIASGLSILVTDQYLFCPVFSFSKITAFAGDSLYNPYTNLDSGNWIKCNFHAHIRCWDGITNGSGSAGDERRIYKSLLYGVNAISNYQNIDTNNCKLPGYMASYEHGYNMFKVHQLALGACNITWKDYIFPQTINNKQDILNRLSADTSAMVILNHPLIRNAYKASDLGYLTNYSTMEVLNPVKISTSLWDAVLSAGKPVFIVGNDDVHNIFDNGKVGNICTWVNATSNNYLAILKNLKAGNACGMIIGKALKASILRHKGNKIPELLRFEVLRNTISCKFNVRATQIRVLGKNGRCLYVASNTDSVFFVIGNKEPYARVEASYGDGTSLFLNPVFRYKDHPLAQLPVTIDKKRTMINRMAGISVLVIWFGLVFRLFIDNYRLKSKEIV